MKNKILYSLLLMIFTAGSSFSQTTQNDMQSTTTQTIDQEHQKELVKTVKEPVVAENEANKTTYKDRQLDRYKRRKCCSAHAHGTYQKVFSEYQRKRLSQYKRTLEKTTATDNNTSKNK